MGEVKTDKKIDVEYVARLARLSLTDAERQEFQEQMEDIVAYVEKVGELDVSGVDPTAHGIPVQNVFRKDETGESLPAGQALANAPRERNGHYEVPRILE